MWLFRGSEEAETEVAPVEDSPEVEAVVEPCPKWRVQLLDLDGAPMGGRDYALKTGAITGTLDGSGYSPELEEPIQEGPAANGRSGYVLFPDLKILPDFDKLWDGYPAGGSLDTVIGIGGEIRGLFEPTLRLYGTGQPLPNEFTNTCVVRTSTAFNAVGQDYIPFVGEKDLESGQGNEDRGYGIPRGDLPVPMYRVGGGQSWPNGRPYAYAARVSEFAPYMRHYFPDAPVVSGGGDTGPFQGKRGIMHFDVVVWDDASGHFDIWDGTASGALSPRNRQSETGPQIRYTAYFGAARAVTLWQHVVIRLKEIQRGGGVCTAVYQMEAQ